MKLYTYSIDESLRKNASELLGPLDQYEDNEITAAWRGITGSVQISGVIATDCSASRGRKQVAQLFMKYVAITTNPMRLVADPDAITDGAFIGVVETTWDNGQCVSLKRLRLADILTDIGEKRLVLTPNTVMSAYNCNVLTEQSFCGDYGNSYRSMADDTSAFDKLTKAERIDFLANYFADEDEPVAIINCNGQAVRYGLK